MEQKYNTNQYNPSYTSNSTMANQTSDLRGTKRPAVKMEDDADSQGARADSEPPSVRVKMERRECTVCAEDTPVNRYPLVPHKNSRNHDRGVCFKCWDMHLNSELDTKAWDQLSCPQCKQVLENREIQKLDRSFGNKMYQKWLKKATKASCESDASAEWKECPSASCDWGCYIIKGDGDIFRCHKCEYHHCLACDVPMHYSETCESVQEKQRERRRREEQEEASSKTVEKTSKPCPKCNSRLDKYIGCDHVTCQICRHEFCWICFADYRGPEGIFKKGNGVHKTSCIYSPARLPSYQAPRNWAAS